MIKLCPKGVFTKVEVINVLKLINSIIAAIAAVLYAYQFVFIPLQWILKHRETKRKALPSAIGVNRYAVLICARNEEGVIGDIIANVFDQTYGRDKLTVFVLADNCTDSTAAVSRAAGAVVYERNDTRGIGKGYAMDALMRSIKADYPDGFDGYFVFDADNLLAKDYIERMDRKAAEGYEILTSYRNSKNYGDNWISSGYSIMFIRNSRYLNHTRSLVGSSCSVSGTGYMFKRSIAEQFEGWPFFTLTEDLEFSAYEVVNGKKIGFCPDAEFYDEQPVKFRQSWRQRNRWAKGYIQVLRKYGMKLFKGSLRGSFSCYDLNMCIMPAFLVTVFSVVVNAVLRIIDITMGQSVTLALLSILKWILGMYLPLFVIAMITVLTEWKKIHTTPFKKIMSAFTSPLFMMSYIPIAFASLFTKPQWKPIEHSVSARDLEKRHSAEQLPTQ